MGYGQQRRQSEREKELLASGCSPWEREPTVFAPRDADHPYRRKLAPFDGHWRDTPQTLARMNR